MESGPIQTRHHLPLPVFGASQAPPGAVVFHRYLADLNRTPPAGPHPARCPKVCREPDRVELSPPAAGGVRLLPRLGDVTPVPPEPTVRVVVETRTQPGAQPSQSGRMIDLLA